MLGKRIVISLGLLSILLLICLIILILPFTQSALPDVSSPIERVTVQAQSRAFYSQISMAFEGNVGQFDPEILFAARGVDYTTIVTTTGPVFIVSYSLPIPTPSNLTTPATNHTPYAYVGDIGSINGVEALVATHEARKKYQRQWTIRIEFVGANLKPIITGEGKKETSVAYFKGDRSNWGKPISNYSSVRYGSLYDGLDLLLYSNAQHIHFFLELAPDADASQLRYKFDGADHLALDADGNLIIFTGESTVPPFQQTAPFAYQLVNNLQTRIQSHFILQDNTVSLELGTYDNTLPLAIQ